MLLILTYLRQMKIKIKSVRLLCPVLVILVTFNMGMGQSSCLVADYAFNGNAKDVLLSKNGSLHGTKPTSDRFGRSNQALQFDGVSDWVQLGTDADFSERTISLWFKSDTFLSGGNYGHIFSTDNAQLKYGATGMTLDNSGGTDRFSVGVGANVKRYTNAKKNVWYHCALVVNSGFIKVFVNGQLFDSAANNSLIHSSDGDIKARIGCSRKTDRFFKGAIDEVKIFNCALSNQEIKNIYNAQAPQVVCPVAIYPFLGNSKDLSGNNLDATVFGAGYTNNRHGSPGSALQFNGISNWVKLGTNADLEERTISLWFKADTFLSNGDFGLVFSTDNSDMQYGATGIAVDNSGGKNRISAGVGANIHRYLNAMPNTWYHYAISVNKSQIKFYLDGNLLDSLSNNSFTHSSDGDNYAHLGCSRKNDRYFKGSIDDVYIEQCALTGAEIKQKFALSIGKHQKKPNEVKIFPNPCNSELQVQLSNISGPVNLEVFNAEGRSIVQLTTNSKLTLIPALDLTSGVYWLKVSDNGGSTYSKFIKFGN